VQISSRTVRSLVQDELDRIGYPVNVEIGSEPSGWPLVAAVIAEQGGSFLGEFDLEPLLDASAESMASVIANGVRALYEEYVNLIEPDGPPNPGGAH
jgi:hypothetical protein